MGNTAIAEGAMVAHIYESWEVSEDGRLYTMHLRKDIVDSHGNQLKAEDAKWIYDPMRGTETGCRSIVDALNIKAPDEVKEIDDYDPTT